VTWKIVGAVQDTTFQQQTNKPTDHCWLKYIPPYFISWGYKTVFKTIRRKYL